VTGIYAIIIKNNCKECYLWYDRMMRCVDAVRCHSSHCFVPWNNAHTHTICVESPCRPPHPLLPYAASKCMSPSTSVTSGVSFHPWMDQTHPIIQINSSISPACREIVKGSASISSAHINAKKANRRLVFYYYYNIFLTSIIMVMHIDNSIFS
jgi:hypothetical protein